MPPEPEPSVPPRRGPMSPEWLEGKVVAGVLSGTSADGIDVVLARPRFEGGGRLFGLEACAFSTEPFPEELGGRVRRVLDGEQPTLRGVALLDRDLGRAFGEAAQRVAARCESGPLALVGSHGQTVYHHDGDPESGPATLQLGDGDAAAEAAGCAVASDFRRRDVAAGGEGAPLVALVDNVLFRDAPRPLAILNLGGMANWTVLSEGDPVGFDTGPAGALLDGLARTLLGQPMDRGGEAAAQGKVDVGMLEALMGHPFLSASPPKSTGRDTFGEAWVASLIEEWGSIGRLNVLATGACFVARAAAQGLAHWGGVEGQVHVAVAGGGVHHRMLMEELEAEIQLAAGGSLAGPEVASLSHSAAFGVPPDAREALAFAALGVRLAVGEPSTMPSVTGASAGRPLGKWSPSVASAFEP